VLRWMGVAGPPGLLERLERFEGWLAAEGADAGGIGPAELPDLWERHVLDSIMFGFEAGSPTRIVDLGSGAGLPGIPLALLFPSAEVMLVDRSGRRVRLARRAARVAGAANVSVVQAGFGELPPQEADLVVMRASLPLDDAPAVLAAHRAEGGRAVLGVGLTRPEGLACTRFPGSGILDPGRWLHIMR
ncbi:MAG: class I SAM-dependent methyltransferase, partial [Acidimicrobiia bacterium]|nr:class I SAM-dependent methyltransferase [Acidimicrobiia bacterium]